MGFVTGALTDVVKRREQSRMEEAEARKEARLAAIRAQERREDRDFTREQFTAQQAALDARDERNFGQQKEFFDIQNKAANERDERNFRQQRELAAEQRTHAERLARITAKSDENDETKARLFVDPKTGTTIPKPAGVKDTDFILAMQQRHGRNIVPMSAGAGTAIVRNGQDDGEMPPPVGVQKKNDWAGWSVGPASGGR